MKRNYSRCFLLITLLIKLSLSNTNAQILQPEPFNLSNGNYLFNEWNSSNPAGTYPSNSLFRVTDGTGSGFVDPTLSLPMNYVYTHIYNATSGSRIEGLGANGISFINIATGISSTDTLLAGRFVGALDLALITSGRDSIKVSWTGRTINPNSREYRIALQYRTGEESNWINIGDEYIRNDTAGHFQEIGPVLLPNVCNNQPLVQLRLRYYYVETGIGGTRAKLAIDDILVESSEMNFSDTHIIEMQSGWNTISSYVLPENLNMVAVFEEIEDDVVLVKNGAGQVYAPAWEFNAIGNWNVNHGYNVFMSSSATLSITGFALMPEENPIPLNQNWNLISYIRNSAMPIATALASISSNLQIAKNGYGQIYFPAWGINQIGDMQLGNGYLMKMNGSASLIYPENSSRNLIKSNSSFNIMKYFKIEKENLREKNSSK